VQSVTPGSPAEAAGLQAGDVIVGVDDKIIKGASDLRNNVGLVRAGNEISIGYLRGTQRLSTSAKIASAGTQSVVAGPVDNNSVLQGATLGEVPANDPAIDGIRGVLVMTVVQDSRAWRNGLRDGDVITAVNREPLSSVQELQGLIGDGQRTLALNLIRNGQALFLIMR